MDLLTKAKKHVEDNRDKISEEFKPEFHLAPEVGWLNDPNGFVFYKGEYHLFYQANPYDSKWDTMHWGHAKSKDLIHWEHLPMALAPDQPYDKDGCFSGSAIVDGDDLVLVYTGVYEEEGVVNQVQCIARSSDGIHFEKHPSNPVIDQENLGDIGTTVDFRDPKVFRRNDKYYSVVASKKGTEEESVGQVFIFHSNDLIHWSKGYVLLEGDEKFGNIWECPDLFELDGKDVLILSPMNMPAEDYKYNNLNSSIAVIGEMNWGELSFEIEEYHEIDYGLDFYAPQTCLDEKGRRVLIAWQQMWGRTIVLDEEKHGWTGMMTVPRILSIQDNKLVQEIPSEFYENFSVLKTTLQKEQVYESTSHTINYLKVDVEDDLTLALVNTKEDRLNIQLKDDMVSFSRKGYGMEIEGEPSLTNERKMKVKNVKFIEVLIDKSSVEVFADGQTMSSTVYALPQANKIEVKSNHTQDNNITFGWIN